MIARHPGTIGVFVKDLESGQTFSLNAERRFRAASLYKLFLLHSAEAAIERGELDPSQTFTVSAEVAAADPYADLQVGTRISVNCALRNMVEMSGNTAADLLEDFVTDGRLASQLHAMGLDHTLITQDTALTSPSDVAQVLESIVREQAVSPAASRRMLELLGRQQQNDRLPQPLPLEVRVAHKTGELPGVRHDAGVIFGPSGAYVLVTMVQDVPAEWQARSAIVDVSEAVYAALEPSLPPRYAGMPPRMAQQVFRTFDGEGRLAMLGDPRAETGTLPSEVATAGDVQEPLRLRPEIFDDLVALQHAAATDGAPFWVRSGFVQPTDAESARAKPIEWLEPCPVEQPERVPDRPVAEADRAAAHARQAWLGTTLSITDDVAGPPSAVDERGSNVWRWLSAHAAEHGFVPALPESGDGRAVGHEPWTLRWVGRAMAQRIGPQDASDYASRATAELQRAEAELAAEDPHTKDPPAWALGEQCWTIATWSGRGCTSRWYFLGLPLD